MDNKIFVWIFCWYLFEFYRNSQLAKKTNPGEKMRIENELLLFYSVGRLKFQNNMQHRMWSTISFIQQVIALFIIWHIAFSVLMLAEKCHQVNFHMINVWNTWNTANMESKHNSFLDDRWKYKFYRRQKPLFTSPLNQCRWFELNIVLSISLILIEFSDEHLLFDSS